MLYWQTVGDRPWISACLAHVGGQRNRHTVSQGESPDNALASLNLNLTCSLGMQGEWWVAPKSLLYPWRSCVKNSLIRNSEKQNVTLILFISQGYMNTPGIAQVLAFLHRCFSTLLPIAWGTASTPGAECDLWLDSPERQTCLLASHNDCWVEYCYHCPSACPLFPL